MLSASLVICRVQSRARAYWKREHQSRDVSRLSHDACILQEPPQPWIHLHSCPLVSVTFLTIQPFYEFLCETRKSFVYSALYTWSSLHNVSNVKKNISCTGVLDLKSVFQLWSWQVESLLKQVCIWQKNFNLSYVLPNVFLQWCFSNATFLFIASFKKRRAVKLD